MQLAIFLHFYQPPTQKSEIVTRVARECYAPVLKELLKFPQAKLNINISGCLLDLLVHCGQHEVIGLLQRAIDSGQVEIVCSSAYHAFLPRIGNDQIVRQMSLQKELLAKHLARYDLHGFFPPEMAFDPKMSNAIFKNGNTWILLDESAKNKPPSNTRLYRDTNGLHYFFRNRELSFKLASSQISTLSDFDRELSASNSKKYEIIALDGETFGHHNKQYIKLLGQILKSHQTNLTTITDILTLDLPTALVNPKKSSWTILDKTRLRKYPYIRWADPENEIHKMQWALTRMAIHATHGERSSQKLDRALFSCQYWWACAKPWWYIEMIESGAHALLNCIIHSHSTALYKKRAATIYHDIISTAFDWMRSGKMQKMVDSEHEFLYVEKAGRQTNV